MVERRVKNYLFATGAWIPYPEPAFLRSNQVDAMWCWASKPVFPSLPLRTEDTDLDRHSSQILALNADNSFGAVEGTKDEFDISLGNWLFADFDDKVKNQDAPSLCITNISGQGPLSST